MSHDPVVNEVRKIRRKIEEECEKRGETYFEYILREQQKNHARLVSFTAPVSKTSRHKSSTG
ncbi:MAG TPA: hypothetical protein DCG57_15725 [Candidatus Riflebacteria bacterium]|nr:hypothetical protein [Candidatus Riflebacteria bacterium]